MPKGGAKIRHHQGVAIARIHIAFEPRLGGFIPRSRSFTYTLGQFKPRNIHVLDSVPRSIDRWSCHHMNWRYEINTISINKPFFRFIAIATQDRRSLGHFPSKIIFRPSDENGNPKQKTSWMRFEGPNRVYSVIQLFKYSINIHLPDQTNGPP